MSENMQCHINIQNTTGNVMTQTDISLPWGHWMTTPPTQIGNGTVASFASQGRKGTGSGTQGSVTYLFADNATSCTISWDIPYTGTNSGGMTINGTGASQYRGQETDSTYKTVVGFPSGGDIVTVYFALGVPSMTFSRSLGDSVEDKIRNAHSAAPVPTLDIATVARAADCGEISGPDLVRLFNGQTSASGLDILKAKGVPPGDLVNFVSNRGLFPPLSELRAAIDFAEYVTPALTEKKLIDIAQQLIADLREIEGGGAPPANFDTLANEMEDAKGLLLAQRHHAPLLPQVNAIDAVLGCVYMDHGAALAQAGGCARRTATDRKGYEKIAEWQHARLLELMD